MQSDEVVAVSSGASSPFAAGIRVLLQEQGSLNESLAQVVRSASGDTQGEEAFRLALHEAKGYAERIPISVASEALDSALKRQNEWVRKVGWSTRPLAPSVTPDMSKLRRRLAEALKAYGEVDISMDRALRGSFGQPSRDLAAGSRPKSPPAGETSNTVVILEQVVSDLEAALGPRHLATLIVRRSLGEARGAAGDDGHAILDLVLVAADLEKISGPGHPELLKAQTSLARLVVPLSNLFR
ncbi:hypothetical protein [Micromonospora maritima]|uniref:hypothetical protein n=1 Tax=Micromonospora maritima TaxID=986711 RepID=UPI00157BCF50|nr:hypothetical protein [Micromonospora maritima]